MPGRLRSPTMRDVAQIVGVSVQTVSAVVNEKPGITPETRDRVFAAINQLGYRPYTVARSLRTRQTHTIALIVSDIANPSFATMASAAEEYAHSLGYSVVVYNTHDNVEREANYIQTATERWFDGVLFVSAQEHMPSLKQLIAAGIPSVAIDRIPKDFDGPTVTLDNFKAGYMAAEHLIRLGHTCIAHISGPLGLRPGRVRLEGFRKALEDHHLSSNLISPDNDWSCAKGYEAMKELLASRPRPTAVFAANDRMAIGAMQAAYESNLRVPEDLSVVGLDDIEVAAFQIPPLTTIRQSFTALATFGVQTLLAILAGETPPQTQTVLEPTLVIRKSTTSPPSP